MGTNGAWLRFEINDWWVLTFSGRVVLHYSWHCGICIQDVIYMLHRQLSVYMYFTEETWDWDAAAKGTSGTENVKICEAINQESLACGQCSKINCCTKEFGQFVKYMESVNTSYFEAIPMACKIMCFQFIQPASFLNRPWAGTISAEIGHQSFGFGNANSSEIRRVFVCCNAKWLCLPKKMCQEEVHF